MGIRKHFEKKPESDLKLQDLSLEQEETKELKFDPETEISKTDWQAMKNELESDRQDNDWWAFAHQAMRLKILFPDKASELDLDSAWQGMKDKLKSDRQNNRWRDFATQAMFLKILAADEVKVTNQGLEITMLPPESFKSEKKPRPERKNF